MRTSFLGPLSPHRRVSEEHRSTNARVQFRNTLRRNHNDRRLYYLSMLHNKFKFKFQKSQGITSKTANTFPNVFLIGNRSTLSAECFSLLVDISQIYVFFMFLSRKVNHFNEYFFQEANHYYSVVSHAQYNRGRYRPWEDILSLGLENCM